VANQAEIGSQVTLITCGRNVRVPSVAGDTVDQAAAIQAAGLVGTISNTTSCDVTAGEIASTTPKGGNLVLTGTTVNLKKSTGLPRNGCA
jgi:beta-lactam-binding protein with PASTA domain